LKKYAAHFFNPDVVGTEAKEAAYAVAGITSEKCLLNHSFLENYYKRKVMNRFQCFNGGLRKIALRNLRNEA
jgi:hypothetical protein